MRLRALVTDSLACDRGDDPGAATRRLVKSNNFTGQTNAVDVDKHM